MSSQTNKLTLIANPRNFAERENNKAYYQAKFFSKGQKESLKEKKRKEEIMRKEIAKRQEFGENGGLSGRCVFSKTKEMKNWEYTKESMKIFHERMNHLSSNDTHDGNTNTDIVTMEPVETIDQGVTSIDGSSIITIKPLTEEEVESWEDLC